MVHAALRISLPVLLLLFSLGTACAGWDLGWIRLSDGAPVRLVSAPAFVATDADRLEAWATGSDGALWHRSFDGLAWSAWTASPAPPAGATSAPALAYRGSGITSMAIRGLDGAIYHRSRTGTAPWTAWENLGGSSPDGPAITADVPRGRVDLWLRGGDGRLWHQQWTGSRWSGWRANGGSPPGGIQSAPAATVRDDVVEIVVRGANGQTFHRAWHADRNEWSPAPDDAGWVALGRASAAPPAVSAFGSDQLHFWVRGAGNDATIYHRHDSAGWRGEFVSEGAPPQAAVALTALHWGAASRPRLALGVQAGDGIYYRGWEARPPGPAVSGALDRIVSLATGGTKVWENTAVVLPPGKAGAPNGAVLLSMGCNEAMWRGDYAAFTQPATGASPIATVTGQALGPLVAAGNATLATPGRLGSCDNIITRLPDGSVMVLRQVVVTGGPTSGANHQRTGAEKSFISRDGGVTWESQTVIDPFDPAFAGGRYGRRSEQGGMDRPELYVPPRGDRAYMTVTGLGDNAANALLFVTMAPYGRKWTLIDSSFPRAAPFMMTATRERLFTFNPQHGVADNWDVVLRWYDMPADPSAPLRKAGELLVAPRDMFFVTKLMRERGLTPTFDGSIAVTLVGQYADATYVRISYSHVEKTPVPRQVLRTLVVRVAGSTASIVPGSAVTLRAASDTGSIVEVVAVEPDYFDLPAGFVSRPVLYYWKETETTPQNGVPGNGWGKVVVRGRMVRGLSDWSEPFVLSRNADDSERSFNAFELTGDYNRGAFFYEPGAGGRPGKFRYLAQWSETSLIDGRWRWVMHTNVVAVDP